MKQIIHYTIASLLMESRNDKIPTSLDFHHRVLSDLLYVQKKKKKKRKKKTLTPYV